MSTLSLPPVCLSIHQRSASLGSGGSLRTTSSGEMGVQPQPPTPETASRSTDASQEHLAAKNAAVARHSRFRIVDALRSPSIATTRPQHLVFVYGSLLPGLHNHGMLANAECLGPQETLPAYEMFSLGSFPAVCDAGNTAIKGCMYRVDDKTLSRLDELESHPNWYCRERVTLATSAFRPWMYLMPRQASELNAKWADPVPTGDWLGHKRPAYAEKLYRQAPEAPSLESLLSMTSLVA